MPPQRLRQISPRVKALCQEYGVRYNSSSWGAVLADALRWIKRLSKPTKADLVRQAAAAKLEEPAGEKLESSKLRSGKLAA